MLLPGYHAARQKRILSGTDERSLKTENGSLCTNPGKHVRIELFLSILKSVVSNSIIWFLFIFVNYKMFLKCHSPFRKIHYDPIFCAKTTQFFKKPSKIEGYNADRKRPSCKDGRFLLEIIKQTVKIDFTQSLYSAVQMQLPETSRLQSSVHQSLEFPEIHCPGADAGTAEILRPGHAPSVPSE